MRGIGHFRVAESDHSAMPSGHRQLPQRKNPHCKAIPPKHSEDHMTSSQHPLANLQHVQLSLDYRRWEATRRKDPKLRHDAERVAEGLRRLTQGSPSSPCTVTSAMVGELPTLPTSGTRGRPKLQTHNPLANFILLLSSDRPRWLDDLLYGAAAVATGASRGRLNVRPGAVLSALCMDTVEAARLEGMGHSLRSAQSIAKAARYALDGIQFYLDKNPGALLVESVD